MISDRHADMGFMEAMISLMAVIAVLGMYMAFLASSSIAAYDPLEDMDPGSLDVDISDGVKVSESYMYRCLGEFDIVGMQVTVTIPYFSNEEYSFMVGKVSDISSSKRFSEVLEYENGRHIPAVIEVVSYI